jgi:N-acetylglutamate synthase-like GNAT family acetyltransferase
MPPKIIIREYAQKDQNELFHLLQLNTPAYFAKAEEADFIHYLEHELEDYFVMELDGTIIGCGGINYSDDKASGKISWDILHPEYQGKGFGKMLLEYRIQRLLNTSGISQITVRTSQLVYPFYEKSGFRLLEIVKDYWAEGYDLYLMEYPVKRSTEKS